MDSNGSDEKRLKLQEKANQNLENYPLFCKEKAVKQKKLWQFWEFCESWMLVAFSLIIITIIIGYIFFKFCFE